MGCAAISHNPALNYKVTTGTVIRRYSRSRVDLDLASLDVILFGFGVHRHQQHIITINKIVDHAIATAFSAPGIGVAHTHLVDGVTGTLDLVTGPLTGDKIIDKRLDVGADAPVFSAKTLELAFEGLGILH